MRVAMRSCLVLLAVVFICQLVHPQHNNEQATLQQVAEHRPETSDSLVSRVRRQSGNRRVNLFALLGQLFTETRNDGRDAVNQISDLVSQNIIPSGSDFLIPLNTPGPDNTTQAPYRISRDEFLDLLRRNFRGLGRLFGKEFRAAIEQSDTNVVSARKEFRDSLSAFFTTNSTNSTT